MNWKQRVRDSQTLIKNAYSLFTKMGIKTHASEPDYYKGVKKHLDYLAVDPKTVDCGIVVLKVFNEKEGTYEIVGGCFGHLLEMDTLEMLLGGKLEEIRILHAEKSNEH
jgi:hypothetical protein